MAVHQLRAVCFDFDGTLVAFEGDFDALLDSLRNELGLVACDFASFRERLLRELRADGPLSLATALDRLLTGLGLAPERFDVAGVAASAARDYGSQVSPRPGARELLEHLNGAGVPMALLSNGPVDMQRAALEGTGLARHFAAVLISGDPDVAARKPDPRIFYLACTALGRVPGEVVMVGDDLLADVEGGLAYGMAAILMAPKESSDSQRYSRAADLAELRGMLSEAFSDVRSR